MQMNPFSNLLNEHWYSSAIRDKHQTHSHNTSEQVRRERERDKHEYMYLYTMYTNYQVQTFGSLSKSEFVVIVKFKNKIPGKPWQYVFVWIKDIKTALHRKKCIRNVTYKENWRHQCSEANFSTEFTVNKSFWKSSNSV